MQYFMTFEEAEELLGQGGTLDRKVRGTPLEGVVAAAADKYLSVRARVEHNVHFFADPSSDKLLPDLSPSAAQWTRTLVLDLDDTIVKRDWNRERGWRVFKRPGLEPFLRHLAQYYEIVVFTDQQPTFGEPVLDRLDPNRTISYRLYRDATRYTQGVHVRDISQLNRDPARVIYITAHPETHLLQPENSIDVPLFDLAQDDTTLLDLMPLLESMVRRNVPDVRDVLTSYKEESEATGKGIPEIFRERTKQMQQWMRQRGAAPRPLLGGRLSGAQQRGAEQ